MRLIATFRGFDAETLGVKYLKNAAQRGLKTGVSEAGGLVEQSAKLNAPVVSGDLRDSIKTDLVEDYPERQVVAVSANTPYAWRIENGFVGTDSLGRVYNQPPQSYMRTALDENTAEIPVVIKDHVLTEVIQASNEAAGRRMRRAR